MAFLHQYRLTKYDPKLRDESGAYTGDDWTMFDQIGDSFAGVRLTLPAYLDVEAQHLVAVASFIDESGTTSLTAQGVEDAHGTFRVVEGQQLAGVEAVEAVRQMLRDEGWCRLADGDRFYVHVGWDYYLYIGSELPCEVSAEQAEKRGLFVDRDFPSPYHADDWGRSRDIPEHWPRRAGSVTALYASAVGEEARALPEVESSLFGVHVTQPCSLLLRFFQGRQNFPDRHKDVRLGANRVGRERLVVEVEPHNCVCLFGPTCHGEQANCTAYSSTARGTPERSGSRRSAPAMCRIAVWTGRPAESTQLSGLRRTGA